MHIPVFRNGDIDSLEKAKMMKERYDVDVMMIGRTSIGYPWIFGYEIKHYLKTGGKLALPSIEERVAACRHLVRSLEWRVLF